MIVFKFSVFIKKQKEFFKVRESINEKLDTKRVADNILQEILEGISCVVCTSTRQAKLRKHMYKLQDEFISNLSDKQKKEYNLLVDMRADSKSSDQIFSIIYGMKVQKVFDYIVENPWEVTNYYENKGIPVEGRYKFD